MRILKFKEFVVKESLNRLLSESKKINDEDSFRSYAETVLKKAFGDKYDEEKANEFIDDLVSKYGEKGDWGAAIGVLKKSLGD